MPPTGIPYHKNYIGNIDGNHNHHTDFGNRDCHIIDMGVQLYSDSYFHFVTHHFDDGDGCFCTVQFHGRL
jgi:hypothetical protein